MEQALKATALLHQWFEDESHHYSEFEDSDVEYFTAVMLYNQFKFKLAVPTMKVMEIGLDFQGACEAKFSEATDALKDISFKRDEEAVEFLLDFIRRSKKLYSADENYLLERIEKHIVLLQERYIKQEVPSTVDFNRQKGPY